MPQPHLRAADTDRNAVAAALGQHMAAGRLTVEEYDERLTRAYAARTYGELDELTTDLPPLPDSRPTAQPTPPAAAQPASGAVRAPLSCPAPPWALHGAVRHGMPGPWPAANTLQAAWRSWLATSIIVLVIWAATSLASATLMYFWPIWVIGPWGAVLLARTVSGRGPSGGQPGRPGS